MLLPIGLYQGITENALGPHLQTFHPRSLSLGPFLHFFPPIAKVAQTFVQQNWVFLALLQVLGQPQGNGLMTINQQSLKSGRQPKQWRDVPIPLHPADQYFESNLSAVKTS